MPGNNKEVAWKDSLTSVVLFSAFVLAAFRFSDVFRTRKPSRSSVSCKYQHAIAQIRLPMQNADITEIQQVLENDLILEKAVKEVGDTLYVYINAPRDTPKSYILAYISSIYQRLWDEMAQHERLNLNCIVTGNVENANFQDLYQLYDIPYLEAAYTKDASFLIVQNKRRAENGMKLLESPECPHLPLDNHGMVAGGASYFFDAQHCQLPLCRRVALGGTFDLLHNGHKKLLTLAASVCAETLIVGIMGDTLLKSKKNAHLIAPYAERKYAVSAFLNRLSLTVQAKAELVELEDPYGPTITDASIEGIVVSSETINGAVRINDIRLGKGMRPLFVFVCRRSDGATLSSTFLRQRIATHL